MNTNCKLCGTVTNLCNGMCIATNYADEAAEFGNISKACLERTVLRIAALEQKVAALTKSGDNMCDDANNGFINFRAAVLSWQDTKDGYEN